MQSADSDYTRGEKRFMPVPHFSPEQQKNPALTHRQLSHLKRYPCCHRFITQQPEPSPFPFQHACPALGRRCFYARAWLYQLGRIAGGTSGLVFATSRGLAPAACRRLTRQQRLMASGEGRRRQAGALPGKSAWQPSRRARGPAAPTEH